MIEIRKEEVNMSRIENTVRCDGCGVEILGAPLVVDGYDYCCQDCRDGLECECSIRFEVEVDEPDETARI
jgi:hypothetical protein